MPTYSYKCKSCGAERDVIKSIHASNRPEPCKAEACSGKKDKEKQMVKILSATPFHLKGRGWYRDGYTK